MHCVDGRQNLVAAGASLPCEDGGEPLPDQCMALGDQRSIPGAAVLLVERDQLTRRRDARWPAGLSEQHQRQEACHLTIRRQQSTASEPASACRSDGTRGAADRWRAGWPSW